jgi:hypothetical protein
MFIKPLFFAGFLFGLFFHPENGFDAFLCNVCGLLLNSSCNNRIYFSGIYKSFQVRAKNLHCMMEISLSLHA